MKVKEVFFFYLDERKICLFRSNTTERKCSIKTRDQLKNCITYYYFFFCYVNLQPKGQCIPFMKGGS